MTRIPEPDLTADGLAYEGRLLVHADEEVVDQGVSFDLGTLLSRRGVLGMLGLGAGAVVLAACTPAASGVAASSATPSPATGALPAGEIPEETAGPYPADGSNGVDVLERSGIVRGDIRSSIDGAMTAAGVPMTLTLTILDTAGGDAPFRDAAVYVWHCDAEGGYSLYSEGLEDVTSLRGVQVTDGTGSVTFTSIFPACYAGRWPHIHFEVYPGVDGITDSANAVATSQVALPQDVCETVYARSEYTGSARNLADVSLAGDNVFGEDAGALQLATVTGDADSGYAVSLVARVDTATAPSRSGAGAGVRPER